MLKIKDNIDLKELEKFGIITSRYKINKNNFNYKRVKAIFKDTDDLCLLTISDKRTIDLEDYCDNNVYLDTLYDLIKADLVEKVDSNER